MYGILKKYKVNNGQWAIILLIASETGGIELDLILLLCDPKRKVDLSKEMVLPMVTKRRTPKRKNL